MWLKYTVITSHFAVALINCYVHNPLRSILCVSSFSKNWPRPCDDQDAIIISNIANILWYNILKVFVRGDPNSPPPLDTTWAYLWHIPRPRFVIYRKCCVSSSLNLSVNCHWPSLDISIQQNIARNAFAVYIIRCRPNPDRDLHQFSWSSVQHIMIISSEQVPIIGNSIYSPILLLFNVIVSITC